MFKILCIDIKYKYFKYKNNKHGKCHTEHSGKKLQNCQYDVYSVLTNLRGAASYTLDVLFVVYFY